jgi:hypothetical protein
LVSSWQLSLYAVRQSFLFMILFGPLFIHASLICGRCTLLSLYYILYMLGCCRSFYAWIDNSSSALYSYCPIIRCLHVHILCSVLCL